MEENADSVNVEEITDREENNDTVNLEFHITTKSTGKITHSFSDSNYLYRRKTVKPSGAAYFTCIDRDCPVRQTSVPPAPRQHNFFSPDDSDVMVDEFGMPIATRTRSSVSSSVSSFSSSVASHQKRCDKCGKIYTRNYFKKHKCLPK